MHDFIVCYAKNKIEGEQKIGWIRNLLVRSDEMNERYSNPDNDPRGAWKSSDFSVKTYSANYDYEIKTPVGRKVKPPQGRCWRTSNENYQALVKDNRIWFGSDGNSIPSIKRFLTEVQQGVVPVTIWSYKEVGHNQEARQELKELFSDVEFPFETPKPVRLLKRIIELSTNENDIILDSFAGSGTTAHAVLELNKEDGGNRNTITAERVRRVIKGVKTAKNENLQKGLGGTFSYFALGEAIEMESILTGASLPPFKEFARYLFFTATGEEFDEKAIKEKTGFIGKSRNHEVFMFYKPDIEWLKKNALTLDLCKALPEHKGKRRLVFAPAKYVDDHTLDMYRIDFCQFPYEIYRIQ